MLKSLLIKIRRKPKAVRDQAALWSAGAFTLLLFGVWVVTALPNQFAGLSESQTGEAFSNLQENVTADAPNLNEISDVPPELSEVFSASATETEPVVIPNEYPSSSTDDTSGQGRPIRIATTSSASSSNPQNSQ